MALLKCPDCGKMVSLRAAVCPDCGCPVEFFNLEQEESMVKTEEKCEPKVNNSISFSFKGNSISYPENSSKFAGLYGDYIKIGFEKFEQLCDVYKNLGNADAVANNLALEAQKLIDDQINIIVKDLYQYGLNLTVDRFKGKYSNIYPVEFDCFMVPFLTEYNSILGLEQQYADRREEAFDNRMRWYGGGFGMRGAIKGAMQAQVLNMGSSILSGIGMATKASVHGSIVDRKKQSLFLNEDVMAETCEGMVVCMNGLYLAYVDELDAVGKLGNKINIDYEQANAKFEAAMAYETSKEKLFDIIIECLSLYPSSRSFYDAAEMEIEACDGWKEFKKFWHLDFLYKDVELALLKTKAEMDDKFGTLKLTQDVLIFEGDDPKDSKNIPIGAIDKVEKFNKSFLLNIKKKFLSVRFRTPIYETIFCENQKGRW